VAHLAHLPPLLLLEGKGKDRPMSGIEQRLAELARRRASLRRTRRELLQILAELANATTGLAYSMVASDGDAYAVDTVAHGPPEFCQAVEEAAENKLYFDMLASGDQPPSDMTDDPALSEGFISLDIRPFSDRGTYQMFFEPYGIHSLLGAMCMSGRVCRGWFGVYRQGDEPPFSRRDLSQVKRHEDALLAAFHAGLDHDPWQVPEEGLVGLFDATGTLRRYSADAPRWFRDGQLCQELKDAADTFLGSGAARDRRIIRRATVKLERLVDADGEPQVQAHVDPLPYARYPATIVLTPTQREVARCAAAGATVEEIARHLDRKPETVRSHLRAIYQRLGISSRVELATMLQEG
jgi:DNA-binding CsgD family transcriptional regulator